MEPHQKSLIMVFELALLFLFLNLHGKWFQNFKFFRLNCIIQKTCFLGGWAVVLI